MTAVLLALNGLAWIWAWHAFHGSPVLLGAALLAWIFGLRHAVDADHIAAIDNVVRKLMQSRRRAWDSGLFFALGHSTTVFFLCLGASLVPSVLRVEGLRDSAGAWGTLVSAAFLLLIGLANSLTLRRLWRARRGGTYDPGPPSGLMSLVLRPVRRLVGRSWHMLPVGLLFGLGFDTASEVALLALTARQAASGHSAANLLVFPALFTAGMVLIDTADSVIMTGAYGWALREPGRKLTYNLAITALSVCVAVGIGGLELLGLLADRVVGVIGRVPLLTWMLDALGSYAGFVVVALLLLVWGVGVLGGRSRARLAD